MMLDYLPLAAGGFLLQFDTAIFLLAGMAARHFPYLSPDQNFILNS